MPPFKLRLGPRPVLVPPWHDSRAESPADHDAAQPRTDSDATAPAPAPATPAVAEAQAPSRPGRRRDSPTSPNFTRKSPSGSESGRACRGRPAGGWPHSQAHTLTRDSVRVSGQPELPANHVESRGDIVRVTPIRRDSHGCGNPGLPVTRLRPEPGHWQETCQ